MNKTDVIDAIGEQRYRLGSRLAKTAASTFGTTGIDGSVSNQLDADLAHDIGDLIFDSPMDDYRKVSLVLNVYEDIPVYWLIAVVALRWDELTVAAKHLFWSTIRRYLETGDPVLSNPLVYALEVDFFEDATKLNEAWHELVETITDRRVLETILQHSGPLTKDYTNDLLRRLKRSIG